MLIRFSPSVPDPLSSAAAGSTDHADAEKDTGRVQSKSPRCQPVVASRLRSAYPAALVQGRATVLCLVLLIAGCGGHDQPAGTIEGSRRPAQIVAKQATAQAAAHRSITVRAGKPPPGGDAK